MARSIDNPLLAVVALLACALVSGGCASPASKLRDTASGNGFERRLLNGGGFDLTVFENRAFRERDERSVVPAAATPAGVVSEARATSTDTADRPPVLHVYLEGDGLPWIARVLVAPDPTPRRPLMLGLMTLDESPALYVGRPCYNGTSRERGCSHRLWTSARYSDQVVDSMAEVIDVMSRRNGYRTIRLFGHSGGGTLAMLLAARLEATRDVVTIAGNLDTDAWTRFHGYSPLRGSHNPARERALPGRVEQWHLVGGNDRVVPPALTMPFIRRAPQATGVRLPTFSHGCCWSRIWPGVLRAVTRGDDSLMPGQVFVRQADR